MKLSKIHTDEKVVSYFRGLLSSNMWNIISVYLVKEVAHSDNGVDFRNLDIFLADE